LSSCLRGACCNALFASSFVLQAINAGLDLYGGWEDDLWGQGYLAAAVAHGKTTQAAVERAVKRTMLHKMKAGLFDQPSANLPWAGLGPEAIGSPASAAVNYDAALQSFVLLKNGPDAVAAGVLAPSRCGAFSYSIGCTDYRLGFRLDVVVVAAISEWFGCRDSRAGVLLPALYLCRRARSGAPSGTSVAPPLPIAKGTNIAVVGPLALATTTLISDYEQGCQMAVDTRTLPSIASAIAAVNTGGTTNALAGIDVNSASTCVRDCCELACA
jgi:beta-glucosidase-like glycosyl hydrolase